VSVRDLSGVAPSEGGDFSLVPEGTHVVYVDKTETRPGPKGDYTSVWLVIVGGPAGDRRLFDKLFWTDAALPVTVAKLQAAGLDTARKADWNAELIGCGFSVVVKHRKRRDNDEMEERIVAWEPTGQAAPRAAAPAAAPWAATDGIDDDIPF
jgi:hypothetical protein